MSNQLNESVVKLEVSFANPFLVRNFLDGIAYKLNSMAEFLRDRLHTDEEKAEKMMMADLTDSAEFEQLAKRIAQNEQGLEEARKALAEVVEDFQRRYQETPPSLKPKSQRDGYQNPNAKADLLAKLKAKKAA